MQDSGKPLVGPGRFQWNTGAWFGSSIGSSAWMIVTSCFLLTYHQPIVAAIPMVGFAVVLVASLVVWSRRDQIYPFTAVMTLLGILAVVFPAVWLFVQAYASAESRTAMNWPESSIGTAVLVVVVPVLMTWFYVIEKSAKSTTPISAD